MTKATCSLPNCDGPIKRRGYCYGHYMKAWRYGTPTPDHQSRALRDVVGRRFGSLVVLDSRVGRTWLCQCDCGNTTHATRDGLLSGMRVACGDRAAHYRTNDAGYYAAHDRVRQDRGLPSDYACVDCGESAAEWSYNHEAEDERVSVAPSSMGAPFSLSSLDYSPRCIRCHRLFDGNPIATGRAPGGRISPGA